MKWLNNFFGILIAILSAMIAYFFNSPIDSFIYNLFYNTQIHWIGTILYGLKFLIYIAVIFIVPYLIITSGDEQA